MNGTVLMFTLVVLTIATVVSETESMLTPTNKIDINKTSTSREIESNSFSGNLWYKNTIDRTLASYGATINYSDSDYYNAKTCNLLRPPTGSEPQVCVCMIITVLKVLRYKNYFYVLRNSTEHPTSSLPLTTTSPPITVTNHWPTVTWSLSPSVTPSSPPTMTSNHPPIITSSSLSTQIRSFPPTKTSSSLSTLTGSFQPSMVPSSRPTITSSSLPTVIGNFPSSRGPNHPPTLIDLD